MDVTVGPKRRLSIEELMLLNFWCWRRLLRVPWTARRSKQSILKEVNPEYSLEGLLLKLKLQYLAIWCKEPTHWKRLMLGKTEGNRKRRQQRVKWLNSINASMDMNLSKLWEIMEDRRAWCTTLHGVSRGQTWLSNWTTTVTHVKKPDDQSL